ncbi:MAG: hypothetical protein A2X18_11020 [Bacteroidetes bacterium GWF2_40_14]|nr:MAG: hypothetical protein A2X18_11020 [Bacteroidetes bacterium GWF2_40_14]
MRRYYESTRIAQLLAKFATNSISESEIQELTTLAGKSGISIDEILKKTAFQSIEASEIEEGKKVWAAVQREISRPNRLFVFGNRFMRYAAIFVVGLAITAGAFLLRTGHEAADKSITLLANETVLEYPSGERVLLNDKTDMTAILRQISTPGDAVAGKAVAEIYKIKVSYGSTHTVTLEDGTTVILYPESELQFPSFFSSSERSVTLVGEGYFDVQKDASRPFTVNAGDASVVVLGTSFNIRAYSNESTTETVLVTGKVVMNQTELQPNQMAIFNRGDRQVSVQNMDASIYRERALGMFIFENRSLDDIMHEFGLWFGFEYSFDDSMLKNKMFRFKLPRTDDFNYLMSLMEKTGELRFEVSGKHVTILPGNGNNQ